MFTELHAVHYIPVLTTLLSVIFAGILFRHYITRGRNTHVLCWMLGMMAYNFGTAIEASITFTGWLDWAYSELKAQAKAAA